jgi:hypothetical protein
MLILKVENSPPHARAQKSKNPPLDPLVYCDSRRFITHSLTLQSKPLGLDPIHLALARFGQIRPSGLATAATSSSILGDFWHLRQCDPPV